jgi:hypothetical protein
MKSLDILSVVYLENLAESLNLHAHSKGRAIAVVLDMETDGTRITQRKIHRGRTGLRKADKEWRGERIFDDDEIEWEGQRMQAGDQRTS